MKKYKKKYILLIHFGSSQQKWIKLLMWLKRNSWVSKQDNDEEIGKREDEMRNDNGKSTIQIYETHLLMVPNLYFVHRHPKIYVVTNNTAEV